MLFSALARFSSQVVILRILELGRNGTFSQLIVLVFTSYAAAMPLIIGHAGEGVSYILDNRRTFAQRRLQIPPTQKQDFFDKKPLTSLPWG